jgi:hypothetical protein
VETCLFTHTVIVEKGPSDFSPHYRVYVQPYGSTVSSNKNDHLVAKPVTAEQTRRFIKTTLGTRGIQVFWEGKPEL